MGACPEWPLEPSPPRAPWAGRRSLNVGVLIDLPWRPEAGGHVKCWERFADAAAELGEPLDLTLHLLGPREEVIRLAPNVRYALHPPVFGSERLPFLSGVADHTDLARWHPGLRRWLPRHDVLHTTHPLFAFGRSAERYARRTGTPLVSSLHTDTPRYTCVFTRQVIQRLCGDGALGRLLLEGWRFDARRAAAVQRRLERHWSRCARVLVSQPDEREQLLGLLPPERIGTLRRGIDREAFHPGRRDRARLARELGLAAKDFVVLYAGRIDAAKSVLTLAEALRLLRERGAPLQIIFAGDGADRAEVARRLGPTARFTGVVSQEVLAWLYASADLFVFPSRTETFGNVVLEAKASGLPVVVSGTGGTAQLVRCPGVDGLVIASDDPREWAATIASLWAHGDVCTRMGRSAREDVERRWPSWREVLEQDLLPVWHAVAGA